MFEIAGYNERYKPTNKSGGELKNADYVKLPVKPKGDGLQALLEQKRGLEVFAIWCLLLEKATEEKPKNRGKLLNHKDEAADFEEIAKSISLKGKTKLIEYAINLLVKMGWIIENNRTHRRCSSENSENFTKKSFDQTMKLQKNQKEMEKSAIGHADHTQGTSYIEESKKNNPSYQRQKQGLLDKSAEISSEMFRSRVPKISKDKISKGKLREGKEHSSESKKKQFLDFVYLTEQEHEKLIERFGKDKTNDYIERLNNGIGSKGYKYKSHYFTILNWSRKDVENRRKVSNTGKPHRREPERDFTGQDSEFGETINV